MGSNTSFTGGDAGVHAETHLETTPSMDTSPGDSMVPVDTPLPVDAMPLSGIPLTDSAPRSESSVVDMNYLISTLIKTPSDSSTLELLTQMLRPIILYEALKYRTSLSYDTDDYIQEGRILIWKIALQGRYRRGSFKRYFATAIRYRLSNVFRDYVLRNFVCVKYSISGENGSSSRGSSMGIAGFVDTYGNSYQVFVESDYAKNYRIKHREQCRRSYAKKKSEAEKTE